MRQISRIDFALFVICLSISAAANLEAQQPNRSGQRTAQVPAEERIPVQRAPARNGEAPRQQAAAAIASPKELPPELEKILKRWEEESAKIKTLHGTQSRSEFNHTFEVEKVTRGPFFLETPDKGRIDMLEVQLKKGAVSKKKKKGKDDEFYALVSESSRKWICTGEAILQLNEEEKTYQKMEIPPSQQGTNIVHSPLPFLFGMKAEEAKSRFTLSIFKETDETVVLLVIPRMEKDRQNYTKAAITLEKKRYLPTQVRMLDEAGLEIVYTFESVVVNGRDLKGTLKKMFGMDADPYHPSLKGYTLVLDDPAAAGPVNPAGARDPRRAPAQPPANANGPGARTEKK